MDVASCLGDGLYHTTEINDLSSYHEKSIVNRKSQIIRPRCDTKMSEDGGMERRIKEMSEL